MVWRWLRDWRAARSRRRKRRDPVFRTPADMTHGDHIRELVRWGERALEAGHSMLILDLTDTHSVDSSLVAGIVLLSRRARPVGATLKLVGYSEQLEALMRLYKVWIPLSQAGVLLEPADKSDDSSEWGRRSAVQPA